MSNYEYSPVHGDQISGSPAILNRYITQILAAGAHFQFVDGETIEVLVPGAGESVVTSLGDTVVEAKPAKADDVIVEAPALVDSFEVPAEAEEPVTELLEEAKEIAEETAETAVEDPEPAPAPKPRGRKPAAAKAEEVKEN